VVATPINCSPEGSRMNIHKNARLTPQGRLLMVRRIDEEGWKVASAATAAGLSERRAYEWLKRYRAGGEIALHDRNSTPARYRHPTPSTRDAEIERLRRYRMSGDRIARQLGLPRSTVGAVLRRLGLGRLKALDPAVPVVRYERERPGELLHLDTKKLGRIEGVGHRITGRRTGAINRHHGIGWEALHVAIDDASRLAYIELLPDEKKESATAFLGHALDWFARQGVRVERIMTDNGSAIAATTSVTPGPAGDHTHPHPTLYAAHQWQSRALHPDKLTRMGLHSRLPVLRRARPGHAAMDRKLQSLSTTLSPRRKTARHKAEQPCWLQQLASRRACCA
jgi:transposase